ncbi:MAG: DUF6777 domain-containing protein [Acidimicrobiales bacterium]
MREPPDSGSPAGGNNGASALGHPTGPRWGTSRARLALALVLLLVGMAVILVGPARGTGAAGTGEGEIFLQAADSPGADTFTPSIAAPPPPTTIPAADTTVAAPAPPAPAPRRGAAVVPTSATAPGLYGGVRNTPACDAAALVGFLEAERARARAWAAAVGVDRDDVGGYVATLTPVVLRVDVRVTDYGFAAGRAVARQAIVQAGTSVLVDRLGFPRVRCASGNPLGEPQAVASAPRYSGPRWPGFTPDRVVVITPAPRTIPVIILVDPLTGAVFGRIPGSVVIIDIDDPGPDRRILVVEPGQQAEVTGSRWPPGTPVEVRFDDPATAPTSLVLTNVFADDAGNFAVVIVIPDTARPGIGRITMAGAGTEITQPVYVIPIAPAVRLTPLPPA